MSKKALGCYQKVQNETATPIQRVMMVYNGINKSLNSALEMFDNNDPQRYEHINNSIQLAEKLIHELQLALDKTNGGEIATQLDSLYSFWITYLSEANREKNREKVARVKNMVQQLTEGWVEVEKQLKNNN